MDLLKNTKNHIKELVPEFLKGKMEFILAISILFIIVVYGFSYINYVLNGKPTKKCKAINSIYVLNTKIQPITDNMDQPMNYYYIKSSYNSCSVGSYVDDYVELCILNKIISQGVRCFDFEIFNINNKPVVSTSIGTNPWLKETYNYIPFSSVLDTLVTQALMNKDNNCPNPTDPLFISLRMKTNNSQVYDNIASSLKQYTNQYLLTDEYSCSNMENFGDNVPLKDLMNKIVIIVDSTGTLLENSNLYEYTNISVKGNPYFKYETFTDTVNDVKSDTIKFAKKKTWFVTPDVYNGTPTNPEPAFCLSCGIQFIGMSYQIFDSYLQAYEYFFDSQKSAFILKNPDLLPTTYNTEIPESTFEAPNSCVEIQLGGETMAYPIGCDK